MAGKRLHHLDPTQDRQPTLVALGDQSPKLIISTEKLSRDLGRSYSNLIWTSVRRKALSEMGRSLSLLRVHWDRVQPDHIAHPETNAKNMSEVVQALERWVGDGHSLKDVYLVREGRLEPLSGGGCIDADIQFQTFAQECVKTQKELVQQKQDGMYLPIRLGNFAVNKSSRLTQMMNDPDSKIVYGPAQLESGIVVGLDYLFSLGCNPTQAKENRARVIGNLGSAFALMAPYVPQTMRKSKKSPILPVGMCVLPDAIYTGKMSNDLRQALRTLACEA